MKSNSKETWGSVARSLHWLMAIAIIGQIILGKVAEEMPRSPAKLDAFMWHKSIGVCLLLLVVARLIWRWSQVTPELPAQTAQWERWASKSSHALLYALMLALPITGWLVSDASRIPFEWFRVIPMPDLIETDREFRRWAANWHDILVNVLLVVLAVHVLAALRHHFLLKDSVLRRMVSGKSQQPGASAADE